MAQLSHLIALSPSPLAIQGAAPYAFTGVVPPPAIVVIGRDFRLNRDTTGTWTDRVMFKAGAGAPEQPFSTGCVWVLRRADGYLAWAGYSDAAGYYTATGLERGVDYVAVGIDPRDANRIAPGQPGKFKTVGAGPFTVPAA